MRLPGEASDDKVYLAQIIFLPTMEKSTTILTLNIFELLFCHYRRRSQRCFSKHRTRYIPHNSQSSSILNNVRIGSDSSARMHIFPELSLSVPQNHHSQERARLLASASTLRGSIPVPIALLWTIFRVTRKGTYRKILYRADKSGPTLWPLTRRRLPQNTKSLPPVGTLFTE